MTNTFEMDQYKNKFEQATPQTRQELVRIFLSELLPRMEQVGGVFYENVGDLYRKLPSPEYLVRRHHPESLLPALLEQKDLEIQFDPQQAERDGGRYANCAVWHPTAASRGLENAFLEGFTSFNGIVTVAGFHKGKDLNVEEIPKNMKQIGTLDRHAVRSADGKVHPEDIDFVILRIPAMMMPEDMLTDDEAIRLEQAQERGEKGTQVFRGFLFPHKDTGTTSPSA